MVLENQQRAWRGPLNQLGGGSRHAQHKGMKGPDILSITGF